MQKDNNEFSQNILSSQEKLKRKRNNVLMGFVFLFILLNFIFYNFSSNLYKNNQNTKDKIKVYDIKTKKLFYLLINKNSIEEKNKELKDLVLKNNSLFFKNLDTQELLSFVSKIAKKSNIDISVFKPLGNKDKSMFLKTSFLLQGAGDYFDILKFLELLENKKTLLKLKEISINKIHSLKRKNKKPLLELNLEFNIFKLKK